MRQRHWRLDGLVLPLNSALQGQGDVWLITRKIKWWVKRNEALTLTLPSDPSLLWNMMLWQTRIVLAWWNTAIHTVGAAAAALTSEPRLLWTTQSAKIHQDNCPIPENISNFLSCFKHVKHMQVSYGYWILLLALPLIHNLFLHISYLSICLQLSLLLFPCLQTGVLQFNKVDYFKGSRYQWYNSACKRGSTGLNKALHSLLF